MKKCLAYLMAIALAAFPVAAQAQAVELNYDDGVFEISTPLSLPDVPAGPPALPVPVVQFDAPVAPGVYALETLSLYLLQDPEEPGTPAAGTYPVTVQIWNLAPGSSTEFVPGTPLEGDLVVTEPDWYTLDLTDKKLTFSGSVRIGILLRDDALAPLPDVSVHLGVDTSALPVVHSFDYDSGAAGDPWSLSAAGNYGIRASVNAVTGLGCQGFAAPLNRTVTMKMGGRTLPLKATLFTEAGEPLLQRDLTSPPLVQLLYSSEGEEPHDVTDFVVPAGYANRGQAFRGSWWGGAWTYNFKTSWALPAGTYTILMTSGDAAEYVIDPTCSATFVIGSPQSKKLQAPKGRK